VRAIRLLGVACGFLTRLPLGKIAVGLDDLGRSTAFFPLVGLGLGLVLAAVARLSAPYVPPHLLAVLLVALLEGVTGGLHLDGLADVFDGLGGGGRDPRRTLAIMQDSRIGAHGAAAVALVLLGKAFAMSEAIDHHAIAVIVAFPVAARWTVVPLIAFFPSARTDGLGNAFSQHTGPWQVILATTFTGAVMLYLDPSLGVPAVIALLMALAFAGAVQLRVQGLTGDAYGAAVELAEFTFLTAASLHHIVQQ
jgi:adenosylcobinamide-GDP ribazoletransferase